MVVTENSKAGQMEREKKGVAEERIDRVHAQKVQGCVLDHAAQFHD
jgi:hypothetical protein